MSKKLNIDYQNLKNLVQESKTKEVLEVLVKEVPQLGIYEAYHRKIIIHISDLHELEGEKSVNTINPDEYDRKLNQIKIATLRLLDDLKAGRQQPVKKEEKKKMAVWQIALLIFSLIGSIAGLSYLFMNTEPKPPIDITQENWQCPNFRPMADFKVLVLPFQDQHNGTNKPHKLIAQKLERFCLQEKIPAGAGIIQKDEGIGILVSKEEARPYIEECEPNMIVWGTAMAASDNQDVSINYYINDKAEFIWLSDHNVEGYVDTLIERPTSYLGYQGATYKIEEVLILLKQTIALKTNQPEKAIGLAKETSQIQDKEAKLISNHLLAESYQRVGQSEKAIETYTKALEIAPNDALSLNNRAHLNLRKKNFNGALTDLDRMVITKQANYETYIKRAEINEELGNLGEAKKDLNQAKGMSPPKNSNRVIDGQIKGLDIKIEVLKNTQAPANPSTSTSGGRTPTITKPTVGSSVVATNPAAIKSIQEATKANQIGSYQKAESKAMKVLKKDAKNKEALTQLIKAKYFQNKNITITELKKSRYLQDIDKAKLTALKDPVFKSIIQNGEVRKAKFQPRISRNTIRRDSSQ